MGTKEREIGRRLERLEDMCGIDHCPGLSNDENPNAK
jgi:hypothetical protein